MILRITKYSLIFFLSFLFSCEESAKNTAKREIFYYVETQPQIKPAEKEVQDKGRKTAGKENIEDVKERVSLPEKYERIFKDINSLMRSKGIRHGDIPQKAEELFVLREGLDAGRLENLGRKLGEIKKFVGDMEIDENFVISKKIRLEDSITRIQPREDLLKSIDSLMAKSEELIKEKNYAQANGLLNEMFLMLGE